jgi:allantoicase
MTDFLELPDLACEAVGGAAIACNDEFFAEKENLLRAHAAVWKEHEYTDRGKWMDGWETLRRRTPGHDWCVIRLGLPGVIRGVVVDTAYFRGNFPESCSLEACAAGLPEAPQPRDDGTSGVVVKSTVRPPTARAMLARAGTPT